jgi:hypothetical protein
MKCYDLLTDEGHLVLLWYRAPEIQLEPVKRAFDLLWKHWPNERKLNKSGKEIDHDRKQEIKDSGLFILDDKLEYRTKTITTRDNFTNGFFSHSAFLALDDTPKKLLESKVRKLYESLDEEFESEMIVDVYVLKKIIE